MDRTSLPGADDRRPAPSPATTAGGGTGHERESVSDLISGVIGDLQGLVRGEIQLAKTEVKESAGTAARSIAMLAAGALLGLIGFTYLMLALVEVLDEWLPRWGAAGVVGLGLLLIAAILALVGKSRLSGDALKPDQTIASLEEDKEWAQRQVRSAKS